MTALQRVRIKIGDRVSTIVGDRVTGPENCIGTYIGPAVWGGFPAAKVRKDSSRVVLVLEKNLLLLARR